MNDCRHSRSLAVITLIFLVLAGSSIAAGAKNHPAKPGPENTGPRGALRPSGPVTVTTNGAVVQGLDVNGCIEIHADRVTVRDVRVHCDNPFGIRTMPGHSGTKIEFSEVAMVGCQDAAVSGGWKELRYSELYGCADGTKIGSDTLVEYNYIHPTKPPGAEIHLDGVQSLSARRVTLRYNNITLPADNGGNAAGIFQTESGPSSDILIDSNWLNGGNYTIFVNAKNHGCPMNVRVTNNKIGRDYRYGVYYPGGCGELIAGNTWEDTGRPINRSGPLPG
ncbi:MAG: hypothetical protein ABR592_12280 [Nitriliruptorales bacterium]